MGLSVARCALLGLAGAALQPALAPAQNVCVIVLDDCGPELISAYDQHFVSLGKPSGTPANTPAIDTLLASRGVMFTRAWGAPMCTPGRAQMLTGRYTSRLGTGCVLEPRSVAPNPGLVPSFTLLPQALGGAPIAYERVALGKWHLASHDQLQQWPAHPLGVPSGTWFQRYAGPLFNLQLAPDKPVGATSYWWWLKYYTGELFPGSNPCTAGLPPCEIEMTQAPQITYATVDTTNDALAVLPTLVEPWFLWVAYNAVHEPAHLVPAPLPTTACGTYVAPPPCNPGTVVNKPARIRCTLEALDAQIARLVCALDEGDTTVVLVGDNGSTKNSVLPPFLPSHTKGKVYEIGLHVPLIVRSPLVAPQLVGTTCDALVDSLDLFATVCDIAQVDPATYAGTDSISLMPYLVGPSVPLRSLSYGELFKPNFVPDPSTGAPPAAYVAARHDQALRDARFKLIRKAKRTHSGAIVVVEEFYDLEQGGPPDTSTIPATPTPDWLELNDLLTSGGLSSPVAAQAYSYMRNQLAARHPSLVQ